MRLPRASEHAEQVALFQRAEAMKHRHPELALLHAVQNWAGVKGPREGAKRKAEGVRAGVPDVHLPVARGGYLSLYVEMKRMKPRRTKTKGLQLDRTKPTAEQVQWMDALRAAGNACVVCWSAEEAWEAIERYLRGEMSRAA